MELRFKDYSYKNKKLSFTLKEKEINGISGNDKIIDLIRLNDSIDNIYLNHKELTNNKYKEIKNKIVFIDEKLDVDIKEDTIEQIMIEYIKYKEVYPKNLNKKLRDSLKIVGLNKEYLERTFNSLSHSEKKLIQISLGLLINPEMIILKEPFKVLDRNNQKRLMLVLKKIKDEYQKCIVFVSDNPEVLYNNTEHLILFKNDNVILEEKTSIAYQRVDFLKKNKIDIPEIVEFVYLAKKEKKVKIDYSNDVRDLIKDIYKHV